MNGNCIQGILETNEVSYKKRQGFSRFDNLMFVFLYHEYTFKNLKVYHERTFKNLKV